MYVYPVVRSEMQAHELFSTGQPLAVVADRPTRVKHRSQGGQRRAKCAGGSIWSVLRPKRLACLLASEAGGMQEKEAQQLSC